MHESIALTGTVGMLRHELQHYPYRSISHHLATIDRYTTLAAEEWHAAGRRVNVAEILVHTELAFARNYVLKAGFMDGSAGLIVSTLNAYYVFLKFAKLWEMEKNSALAEPRE